MPQISYITPRLPIPFAPIVIPPRTVQRRFHVYDPRISMFGPYRVVVEDGLRVCYMTDQQGLYWVQHSQCIGLLPWVGVPLSRRRVIKQMLGNRIYALLPPVLAVPLSAQVATVSTPFSYAFSAGCFSHPDSALLVYTARLVSGAALPVWLTFTPGTRSFSGTPSQAGTVSIRVTATDPEGNVVTGTFDIVISA